ncbi:MAG: hypothetical protein DRJ05_00695 [Bacteroidetes bacterium]|nr:MAG: hypothetical protein DRJ05_00695 [Bacteroidota bacterium]
MAGYKETPRQKMIGMMYLVLTALLALNVSRQILNSYLIVNDSMVATTKLFSHSVDEMYADFEAQYQINPVKVKAYRDEAIEVKTLSNDFIDYIKDIKAKLIVDCEGGEFTEAQADTAQLRYLKSIANFDIPTHFFLGTDLKKGEAPVLKANIEEYKEKLYSYIKAEDKEGFSLGLITDGDYTDRTGQKIDWATYQFDHTVLAATVVILNNLIAEVYNAEANIVNYLYSSISAKDFKFDEISAKVIANSNYVFKGDEYNADVIVAAYDSRQDPEVYIKSGVDSLPVKSIGQGTKVDTEFGKGVISLPASSEGTQKYAGFVKITDPMGADKYYHFKSEYMVAVPSATISATKMNVFYRGVDNPVAISASGKADNQLKPRLVPANAGKISSSDEGWVVKIDSKTAFEVEVEIYADDEDGQMFMGKQPFRIKDLPDPVALVYGAKNEKISTKGLLANPFLACKLPEYVEFEFKFKVTSFTMVVPKGGGKVSTEKAEGQTFTLGMKNLIGNLKKNDMVTFKDVRAQGPLRERKINSITVTIN